MCKRRPGNRCTGHATTALRSAQRRAETATRAYNDAESAGRFDLAPARQQHAKSRVTAAREHLTRAVLDYDSTPAGMRQLRESLSAVQLGKDASKADSKQRALTLRLEAAKTLRAERARLSKAMPPPTQDQFLTDQRNQLAARYDSLAVARARAIRGGSTPGSDDVHQHQVTEAEQRAFTADNTYRFHADGGYPNPNHLSPDEVRAMTRGDNHQRRHLALLSHMRAAERSGVHGPMGDTVASYEGAVHHLLGWSADSPPATPTADNNRAATAGTPPNKRKGSILSGRKSSGGGRGQLMQELKDLSPLDGQPARAGAQQKGDVILGGLQA